MSKILDGLKSLTTITANAVKGVDQTVADEVKKQRLDLCNGCENLNMLRQCKKCLCFVDQKTKFKQEECPIKKWNKEL